MGIPWWNKFYTAVLNNVKADDAFRSELGEELGLQTCLHLHWHELGWFFIERRNAFGIFFIFILHVYSLQTQLKNYRWSSGKRNTSIIWKNEKENELKKQKKISSGQLANYVVETSFQIRRLRFANNAINCFTPPLLTTS